MTLKLFIVFSVVCAVVSSQNTEEWKPVSPSSAETKERTGKFISFKKFYTQSIETNEVDHEAKADAEGSPDEALANVYSECVLQFSFPCLQKKFLVFLDRLGRMDGFQIFGDYLTMHKVRNETNKPITEKEIEARMNYKSSAYDLDSLVQYSIERFFNNHVMRVRLPFGLTLGGDSSVGRSASTDVVEIGFERGMSEGRGKKKKMLMMFLMMLKMKLAMLLPLAMILLKIKVIKALILAKLALVLAKLSLLKKLMEKKKNQDEKHKIVIIHDPHHSSGGGGGGGHHDSYGPSSGGGGDSYSSHGGDSWSSGGSSGHGGGGGGGGWGRSLDAHSLAYRGHDKTSDKS